MSVHKYTTKYGICKLCNQYKKRVLPSFLTKVKLLKTNYKNPVRFYLPARTASKSSSISFEGGAVTRETTTIQINEKMNAGNNS